MNRDRTDREPLMATNKPSSSPSLEDPFYSVREYEKFKITADDNACCRTYLYHFLAMYRLSLKESRFATRDFRIWLKTLTRPLILNSRNFGKVFVH